MAVGLSEIDIGPYLTESNKDNLTVSCINSPQNVTVSGKMVNLVVLQERLLREGVMTHLLDVDTAYHSRLMEPVISKYSSVLGSIQLEVPDEHSPVMFSSVSGSRVATDKLGEQHWVNNLINPVLFSKTVREMCGMPSAKVQGHGNQHNITPMVNHVVEIGPHAALRRPIKEILSGMRTATNIGYDSVLIKGKSALESSLAVAGRLYTLGCAVDLVMVNSPPEPRTLQMLTDLPQYPFNHNQRYWIESRLSRNFRFREAPEHELLGTTVPDWNPLDARWRKIIRLSETGWLAEHKIQGAVLYPAAAVIIMAIEAARILSFPNKEIKGYRVQDFRFSKPMTLSSEDPGLEVETSLRPHADLLTRSSSWWDFKLYVLEKGEWVECSHGIVVVEYHVHHTQLDAGDEQTNEEQHYFRLHREGARRCDTRVRPEDLYEQLRGIGMAYGPSFQVLRDLAVNINDHEAMAHIAPCNWNAEAQKGGTTQPVLHPSALDGMFQLILPALSHGCTSVASIMLPNRLDSLWITGNGVNDNAGTSEIYVHAKGGMQGIQNAEFSMTALDIATGTVAVVVNCFQSVALKIIARPVADDSTGQFCYNIEWKPDFLLLSNQDIKSWCESSSHEVEAVATGQILDNFARIFITEALNERFDEKKLDAKPHLRKYLAWMQGIVRGTDSDNLNCGHCNPTIVDRIAQRTDRFEKLERSKMPKDQLLLKVGKNLRGILNGEIDALALFYEDDGLLEGLYRDMVIDTASSRLATYLDVMAHKAPNMKILEIGAGMGSFTRSVLDTLIYHGRGTPRFANYTFTDISSTFFEKATNLFPGHINRVTTKIFDIEQNPLEQGFMEGMFDIVIASNVGRTLSLVLTLAFILHTGQ